MASRWEKAAGMGATGWSLGGPVGGAIGAGLGLLFGSDKNPELGEFRFSPESLRSLNFADLDIASMNPELYRKLQQNDLILRDMQGALASRREGMTANEQRQMSDYMNRQGSGMASSGLAGTPIGNAMMADSAARLYDSAKDRAFQEYMQLQGGVANQANANFGNMSAAQANLMNQANANRAASMSRDQLLNDREMAQFQDASQSAANSSQFYGNLLNGGLQGIASQNFTGAGPMLGDLGKGIGQAYSYMRGPAAAPAPFVPSGSPMTGPSFGYSQQQGPSPGFGYGAQPQSPYGFGYGNRGF